MSGHIDGYSAWRQAETAYMTWRLFEESPPEILHMKVPYRGNKDVHLAEFPVQPIITSYIYKLTGGENLFIARVVTLFFFLSGAYIFFQILKILAGRRFAYYAAAIYVWLPLGIGYSRAIHVDFCIIFFCVVYLYFALLFFIRGHWQYWILSCLAATVAFLMKAPYCFYLAFPLFIYVMWERKDRTLRNFLYIGSLFIVPLIAAVVFSGYRIALEANETDSLVYCMKWTPELCRHFFFGHLSQRFDSGRWYVVLRRLYYWVFTPGGIFLASLSVFLPLFRRDMKKYACLGAWCLGVMIYALLLFPIFSSSNDYYSLPLLMPTAVCLTPAMLYIVGERKAPSIASVNYWNFFARIVAVYLLVIIGSISILQKTKRFDVDWQRIKCGEAIRENTDSEDLVLSVTLGRSTGWSDPRILYYAKRKGWAIEFNDLTQQALDLYMENGMGIIALFVGAGYDFSEEANGVLNALPMHKKVQLAPVDGHELGRVLFWEIGK